MKFRDLIFLALFFAHTSAIQSQVLPQNRFSDNKRTQDFFQRQKSAIRPFDLSMGYTHVGPLHAQYGLARKEGIAKYRYGAYLGLAYTLYPIRLEVKGYYGAFGLPDSVLAELWGGEFGASVIIPTFAPRLARVFLPYVGMSYDIISHGRDSVTAYYVSGLPHTANFDEKREQINENRFFWKAGATVNVSRNFFFTIEYKKSISTSSKAGQFPLQMLNCGFGFRGESAGIAFGILSLAGLIALGSTASTGE